MSSPLTANNEHDPFQGAPSYPLRHRVMRALWVLIWALLASWTPAPFHRWRIFLLRLAGAKVHKSAHVYSSARIWYPPNLLMEAGSCLAPGVRCYCMAPIHLGRHATVSQGAHLCAGMHDIEDPTFQLVVKPITLEANAWVAAEAFVGPGVHMGEAAVLGARAVLFKNAEPYGVYIGNPAVLVKYRSLLQQKDTGHGERGN